MMSTFSSAHAAEIVNGQEVDSYLNYPATPSAQAPCLQWFLFFCIKRGNAVAGYDASTEHISPRDDKGQAFEPAMTNHLGKKGAPIMGPFTQAFNRCAPGCTYVDWGVWGDARHQRRRSCHNSGSAIDIHAIKCNGKTHRGGTGDRRFLQFRSCMHNSPGLYTIHGSGDHKQHIDIALKSCQINGVGKIQTRR